MAISDPRIAVVGRKSSRPLVFWSAISLFVVCGCSSSDPQFAPVEGTVTHNGRPVPYAQVIFFADDDTRGPRATGLTDKAGHFRLAADDGRDGAPVGHHRVCVIDATITAERFGLLAKRSTNESTGKAPATKKAATIPPAYGRPSETPLRAEVRPGTQTIDFQVP